MKFETRNIGVFDLLSVQVQTDEVFDAGRLRQETLRMVEKGSRRLVIDLGAVDYLYSDSINALVALNRRMLESSGRLGILVPNARVHDILVRAGLENIMRLYRSEADLLNDSRELMRQSSAWTRPAELLSAASASQMITTGAIPPKAPVEGRDNAPPGQRAPRKRVGPRIELRPRRRGGRSLDQDPPTSEIPLPPDLPNTPGASTTLRMLSQESSAFDKPELPRPSDPGKSSSTEPSVFQVPDPPREESYRGTDPWLLTMPQTGTGSRGDRPGSAPGALSSSFLPKAPAPADDPQSSLPTSLNWETETIESDRSRAGAKPSKAAGAKDTSAFPSPEEHDASVTQPMPTIALPIQALPTPPTPPPARVPDIQSVIVHDTPTLPPPSEVGSALRQAQAAPPPDNRPSPPARTEPPVAETLAGWFGTAAKSAPTAAPVPPPQPPVTPAPKPVQAAPAPTSEGTDFASWFGAPATRSVPDAPAAAKPTPVPAPLAPVPAPPAPAPVAAAPDPKPTPAVPVSSDAGDDIARWFGTPATKSVPPLAASSKPASPAPPAAREPAPAPVPAPDEWLAGSAPAPAARGPEAKPLSNARPATPARLELWTDPPPNTHGASTGAIGGTMWLDRKPAPKPPMPAPRDPTSFLDLDDLTGEARPSRKPLWIALVVLAAVGVLGIALFLAKPSSSPAIEVPKETAVAAPIAAPEPPPAPEPVADEPEPIAATPAKPKPVAKPETKPVAPVAAPTPAEDHAPVKIFVTSRPSGAVVLLDGSRVGTTPCEVTFKRAGKLEFTLAGYRQQTKDIDPEETRGTVSVQLVADAGAGAGLGRIYISSAPVGAEIVVGGKVLGKTPRLVELPVGSQKVTVRSGVLARTRALDIQAGTNAAEHFSL